MDRHSYQREVERLLDEIRVEVDALRRLHAAGARGPALADRKRELAVTRRHLARIVGGGLRAAA